MRMHADRAEQRSLGQTIRSGLFRSDGSANFASAALPLLLGTFGMALLSVGAVQGLLPLVFAGVGLAVVGFAVYLIAAGIDRADEAARPKQPTRAERARAEYQKDVAEAPLPRNPLADEAVAALTGEGKGGIWPPLPSQVASGEVVRRPQSARAEAKPVDVWAPGEKVAPPGWDDDEDIVEFEDAATPATPRAVRSGGQVTFVDGAEAPAPAERRPATARADPPSDGHDFRVWPGAKDLDSWTTFTGERRPQSTRFSEEEIKKAMDERRQKMADRLPTVGAILANVSMKETEMDRLRREATRGKCSQCEAIIWAPKKRPIVLKCPGCGHKAKLY